MVDEEKTDGGGAAEGGELVPVRIIVPALRAHGASRGNPCAVPEAVARRLIEERKAVPDLEAIDPDAAAEAREALEAADFDRIRGLHGDWHPAPSNRSKAELSAELAELLEERPE